MASVARAASDIPSPTLLRLLGRWGPFLALARDPAGTLQSMYRESGPVVTLVRGRSPIVMALGLDAHRQLLTVPRIAHPMVFPCAQQDGTASSDDAPRFSFDSRHQDVWHTNTIAQTESLLQRWPIGREIDVSYAMTTLLFHIVWQTLFGTSLPDLASKVGPAWRRWTQAYPLLTSPMTPHLPFRGADRRLRDRSGHLAGDIRHVLVAMHSRTATPSDSQSILSHFDEQNELEADALIALIVRFLVVGHTCGSALTWTLFLLSQHPLTIVDLHDKLWSTLHGSVPTVEQLKHLPLLNAIVDESLRLLPPISIGPCTTLTPIELAGYELPAGTTVVYSPFLAHRTPEIYLWPHAFRPERWRSIAPEPYQFLPLGAHPDMVAYMPLAYMLIRLVLAMVVQHSFLGLAPGVRIDLRMRLTLEPRTGLPMIIAPVDRPVIHRTPEGNIGAALSGS